MTRPLSGPSRRSLLAGSAASFAGVAFLRYPAAAAQFSYKLGVNLAATHPQVVHTVEAAAKIKEQSGGQFEVNVFPNSALGSDTGMLTQLRSGALELLQIPDSILGNVVPAAGLSAVPFVFESSREAWAAVDGPMRGYVRAALEKASLPTVTRTWDVGFKEIVASRAVSVPDDLKGLKIRITPSPVQVDLFKSMGAIPVAIPYAEVYTALQSHLADASESTLTSVEDSKFFEVARYLNLTKQNWVGMNMIANGDAWSALPKNLREIAERNFEAAVTSARNDIAAQNSEVPNQMKSRGMVVGSGEFAAFQTAVSKAGLFAKWRASYGPDAWAMLETAAGKKLG